MLFNSFEFLVFFVLVYGLYLCLKHRAQNWLLIIASCLFYAAWSWKFLFLMFASISTDFWCSHWIARTQDVRRRRLYLGISIGVNLGILGFFKYFNFFISNFQDLLLGMGFLSSSTRWMIDIILPLGISFYTFEAISYVVDVYKRKVKPADNYWDYVLFVIYFPHLIAGPIMRAKNFIPQVALPRKITLTGFYEGCFLFFWGLFEKIFIADNLAKFVDPIFAANAPYNGEKVLLALYAFAFQILCDFDGYSNMARGMGKCMGFDIAVNFRQPYFSTNPREFWQRWHITLSSWLRDYVYIPLGGNRQNTIRTYLNLFLTMLIGGLWHGASWTFVLWGAYQGTLLVIHRLLEPFLQRSRPTLPLLVEKAWKAVKILFFFQFICLGWLLFRCTSLRQASEMLAAIGHFLSFPTWTPVDFWLPALGIFLAMFVGFFQYKTDNPTALLQWPWWLRTIFYITCYFLIIFLGCEGGKEFIYFQF